VCASGRERIVSVLCLKWVYICVFKSVSLFKSWKKEKKGYLRYLLKRYNCIYIFVFNG
jgi:hypothetical protein